MFSAYDEENLWHHLRRLGLSEMEESHPVLGNIKQTLEALVQQRLGLQCRHSISDAVLSSLTQFKHIILAVISNTFFVLPSLSLTFFVLLFSDIYRKTKLVALKLILFIMSLLREHKMKLFLVK